MEMEMSAYSYECFVKNAFGISERGEDSAGLAESDIYTSAVDNTSLNKLKIGAGYAISIYNRNYANQKELCDTGYFDTMDQFIDKVLSASSSKEISNTIEEYKELMEELDKLTNLGDTYGKAFCNKNNY